MSYLGAKDELQNTYVCECCDDCLRTAELATAINTSKVPKELPTKLCTDLNKKRRVQLIWEMMHF